MHKYLLLVIMIITYTNAFATTQQEAGLWTNITFTGPLSSHSHLKYLLQTQIRFSNHENTFDSNVNRFGLAFPIANQVYFWVGYDFIPSHSPSPNKTLNYEHLFWQQLNYTLLKSHSIKITGRTRIEQRHRIGTGQLAWRLRQRLLIHMATVTHTTLQPIIFDEWFFNINRPRWVSPRGLSQNRLFLGLQDNTVNNIDFIFGYKNIYLLKTPHNTMIHALYLALIIHTH